MRLNSLLALALTATVSCVSAHTSPLFVLASTKADAIPSEGIRTELTATDVQHNLWGYLASCPTRHYAVVVEPLTLSYFPNSLSSPTSFIPKTPNARSIFSAENVDGKVNLVHVLNTILMDCLHHCVLRVKELDTSPAAIKDGVPRLDREVIEKSIIYANMPEVDTSLTRKDYAAVMQDRKDFVEEVIEKYFEGTNYTLIYIREQAVSGKEVMPEHDDGSEIPFVADQKH